MTLAEFIAERATGRASQRLGAPAWNLAKNLERVSKHGLPVGACGNAYEVQGSYAAVLLDHSTGTKRAVIDVEDLEKVLSAPSKWVAAYDKRHNAWYAQYQGRRPRRGTSSMHRMICDAGKSQEVDHHDHDGLNNRRSNLTAVSTSLNQLNRKGATSRSSTGILGVTFNKHHGKFRAFITVEKRQYYLGFFDSKEAAGQALRDFRRERGIECQL